MSRPSLGVAGGRTVLAPKSEDHRTNTPPRGDGNTVDGATSLMSLPSKNAKEIPITHTSMVIAERGSIYLEVPLDVPVE